jgi:hypothetical protein
MTAGRKIKVSVSLDAAVVSDIDRHAANEGGTRSAVMERWLRLASRSFRAAQLERETASYYDALTTAEREDDAAWAAASSRAARRLQIDEVAPSRPGRRPPRGGRRG